jgi:hypothetical protein
VGPNNQIQIMLLQKVFNDVGAKDVGNPPVVFGPSLIDILNKQHAYLYGKISKQGE